MNRRLALFLLLVFCSSTGAWAQAPSVKGGARSFEVASIKPSPPAKPNPFGFPTRSSILFGPGGRVDASQATLLNLILRAFDLNDFQLLGAADWMTKDRFEVAARAETDVPVDSRQTQVMLRELLAERFKLRTHTEVRDLPVFRLVVVRRDGKLGPQLRPSSLDCGAIRSKSEEPDCRPSFDANAKAGTLTVQLRGESMAELARVLTSPDTRRVVRDETGLTGNFDAELTFAPEPLPGFPRLPHSENGTSLFTALPEQLGLRLEAARGPVEVLVIDSAERPTGN